MSRTNGFSVPSTFIIFQIIFGKPLRAKKQFRTNDVEELLIGFSSANLQSALKCLVGLNWLTVNKITVSMQGTKGGRPIRNVYTRTTKGEDQYKQLVRQLKSYGIVLQ